MIQCICHSERSNRVSSLATNNKNTLPNLVPNLHAPPIGGPGLQRPGVRHHVLRAFRRDLPRTPDIRIVEFSGLRSHTKAAGGRLKLLSTGIGPRKARRAGVDTEGYDEVLQCGSPIATRRPQEAIINVRRQSETSILPFGFFQHFLFLGIYEDHCKVFHDSGRLSPSPISTGSRPTPKRMRYSTGVIPRLRRNMFEK